MVTNVPRLGDPVDMESLGERHLDYWGKAVGTSSNLGYGLCVVLTPSTGVCALATDGDFGEFGMVVRLAPNYNPDIHSAKSSGVVNPPPTGVINTEDSDKVLVLKGPGARGYMKFAASGSAKPRGRLVASAGGLLKAYVEPTWTSSTPANFNSPMRDYKTIVGEYEGHYGESMVSLDKQPTDAAANETIRVRFGSFPA